MSVVVIGLSDKSIAQRGRGQELKTILLDL